MARSKSKSKNRWLLLLVVLLAGAVVLYLVVGHKDTQQAVVRQKNPTPTVKQAPSRPAPNPKNAATSSSPEHGVASSTSYPSDDSPASQWTASSSEIIIIHKPSNDSTIKDGAVLSGTASVENVQFRLIDNASGVIASGPITVSGGKFSSVLHFTPHSSSGRLDVFSTKADGSEINEVQLNVHF